MAPTIHPTAIVHPQAVLADDVVVGAQVFIGEHVSIGSGTIIDHHATVEGHTTIGSNNHIYPYAALGLDPQDITFKGEPTRLVIGNGNLIREFVTINKGTNKGGGLTRIGDNNFLMAYVHVAHDCEIGDRVIMANSVNLGGHTKIESNVVFGGLVGMHHFCTIGKFAFVGGLTRGAQDVPPFFITEGNPARTQGLNIIGLQRNGFSDERIAALKKAYRLLYRSNNTVAESLRQLEADSPSEDVKYLIEFVRATLRGKQGRAREVLRGAPPKA